MSDAGEIIKSGAFDKLADIVRKLAGPMAEEVGLLMADKIKVYRVKNWVNVVKSTSARQTFRPVQYHHGFSFQSSNPHLLKTMSACRNCGLGCWQAHQKNLIPYLRLLLKRSNS